MSDWERLAGLELEIEDYSLEPLQASVSSDFERKSTVIHLRGAGQEGLGEDVTYDAEDHEILQAAGPVLPLAGRHTIGSFSELLAGMSLFPEPPQREVSERYRTWAYESAALDLALRQAGVPLHEALGRTPEAVRFVVSLRLGEPPSLEPLEVRLRRYPGLRFKLDPTSSWDETPDRRTGRHRGGGLGRLQGLLLGLDRGPAPRPGALPARGRGLPGGLDRGSGAHRGDRRGAGGTTVSASPGTPPIHSIEDIEALPYPPKMVNIKPSRLGGLRNLLDAYAYCAERGIGNYGGGQFELGVGRGQNQYLASMFHADAPNDVAPTGYNLPQPPEGLPSSPLAPAAAAVGFRWG